MIAHSVTIRFPKERFSGKGLTKHIESVLSDHRVLFRQNGGDQQMMTVLGWSIQVSDKEGPESLVVLKPLWRNQQIRLMANLMMIMTLILSELG